MTSPHIIQEEYVGSLEAFEAIFAKLEGVSEEHLSTLRRASTTTASRAAYPQSGDALGQAAYMAAGLRGLAEAVAVLQGNEATSTSSTTK